VRVDEHPVGYKVIGGGSGEIKRILSHLPRAIWASIVTGYRYHLGDATCGAGHRADMSYSNVRLYMALWHCYQRSQKIFHSSDRRPEHHAFSEKARAFI